MVTVNILNRGIRNILTWYFGFDVKETGKFAQKHTINDWHNDFKLLYGMVIDKHFFINSSTYLTIAGALAYAVFPTDIIPDFILETGYINDAFVVEMAIKSISNEIEKYRTYKIGV